jgi:2-polyprenyl-6-methoxyphenol hydroxylase-like FAD-dependent oxidoreductase
MDARFDVLVAGGGLAGIAAAISAARLGARTLLVERDASLGGNATAALVHTVCGLYLPIDPEDEAASPQLAHAGFPRRLAERLAALGGTGPVERAGGCFVLPTRPQVLERLLPLLCEKTPGLALALDTLVQGAELARSASDPSRITTLHQGVSRGIEARIVIDATGDATVAALGGAEILRASPAQLQHASYVFRLRDVESEACMGFARMRVTAGLAGAARHSPFPPGCDSVLVRPGAPGEAYLTVTLPKPDPERFDPLDAAQLAALEAAGRTAAEAILPWLHGQKGLERCAIDAWPRRPGIRETRRVRGRVIVEADDLRAGRLRDDAVALSTWSLELWESATRPRFEPIAGPSSVPLGALVSASHPQLAAAGRCLSASHEALGALRVLGTAMATGEAAGVAAALAADASAALADVAPRAVRASVARLAEQEPPW